MFAHRNYLFSRSVISTSPVDSSFASHPDDFGSAQDIQNLTESELSESLLYCLNGNRPTGAVGDDDDDDDGAPLAAQQGTSRKRSNAEIADQLYDLQQQHPKKLVVCGQPPGETSL